MSPEQREALYLPASRALLDGWCGPVEARDANGVWHPCVTLGWSGNENIPGAWVYSEAQAPLFGAEEERGADFVSAVHLRLDLSRAEVRDRVARVLAAQALDLPVASGVAVQFVRNPLGGRMLAFAVTDGRSVVTAAVDSITCPALAALDPDDDTRLPDGSRLVDALALAGVAREVPCG